MVKNLYLFLENGKETLHFSEYHKNENVCNA